MGTALYERYLAEQQGGGTGDTSPPDTPLYKQYVASQSEGPPTPGPKYTSPFAARHPDYAKRAAAATAADTRETQPGIGQTLATHILNTAQGYLPGMELLEAGAGELGSQFTKHPMSFTESRNTLRAATNGIDPRFRYAERIAGGIASPFRAAGIVKGGAAYGGLDALLSADDESAGQRAVNTAIGTGTGAVLGTVLERAGAPLARAGAKALTRVVPGAERLMTRLTGSPMTDQATARAMLANALETGGVRPGVAAATVPLDQPVSMMELGSRNVPSLVRAARNVPTSTAAQTTDRFLEGRAADAGRRIEGDVVKGTGHVVTDTELPVEQHIEQARTQASPLYEQAEAHGQIQDPETVAEIQRLLKEPVFQRAWTRGESLARMEGSGQTGTVPRGPAAPPKGIDPAAWANLRGKPLDEIEGDLFVPNAAEQKVNPTVRQINRWKKGLDAEIESGFGSSNALSKDEARVAREQLNGVLDRVDAEVPAFKQARATFKGEMDLSDAAAEGAKHFAENRSNGAIARGMAKMSPGERAAYVNNARNQLVAKIQNLSANPDLPEAARDINIVQRLMRSKSQRERIGMLFDDEDAAQRFFRRMKGEAVSAKTSRFLRNQPSTKQQMAESETSVPEWMGETASAVRHPIRALAKKVLGKTAPTSMSPKVAGHVASQATATGKDLQAILTQMEVDRAARDQGRKLLTRAVKGATIGGTSGADDWRSYIEDQRRTP